MPFEFAEIKTDKIRTAYLQYVTQILDDSNYGRLVEIFSELTNFIAVKKSEGETDLEDEVLKREFEEQQVESVQTPEQLNALNSTLRALIIKNFTDGSILYFENEADRAKYASQITKVKFASAHWARTDKLQRAVSGFHSECVKLTNDTNNQEKLRNSGLLDQYNSHVSELKRLGDALQSKQNKQARSSDKIHTQILKEAGKIDELVQKCKIDSYDFDISYIYLIYCLNILKFAGTWSAKVVTLVYIMMRLRRFGSAAAKSAITSAKAFLWRRWEGAKVVGNTAIKSIGIVAGAIGAAGKAAKESIKNKPQRLRNQRNLGSAFGAELSRMDERLQASKILRETKDTLMKHPTRVGTHLENLLNVVGVTAGFVSMGIYIPARVSVGVMNERYSFINQVRLGATGSLLRDKSAMRDSSGTRMFNIKYSKSDETFEQHGGRTKEQKKIDAKREIRNERLEIQTIDFNNHEPDEMNGAHAIIELDDDRKGYTVALTAHSEEALRKILQLLCNAVKNVDGNKLVVEFVKAPSDVDIKRIMQDALRATPKVAISYRHGELAEETINFDPSAGSASKNKRKRR